MDLFIRLASEYFMVVVLDCNLVESCAHLTDIRVIACLKARARFKLLQSLFTVIFVSKETSTTALNNLLTRVSLC